jgi:hypothetical protein
VRGLLATKEYAQVTLIEDSAQLIVYTGSAVGHRSNLGSYSDDNSCDSPSTSIQSLTNAFRQEAQHPCGVLVPVTVRIDQSPAMMHVG